MRLGLVLVGFVCTLVTASAQRPGRTPKLELPQDLKDAFERSKSLKFSGTRVVTFVRAGRVETHNEYVTKDGSNLRIEFSKDSPYSGQIIVETAESRRHYFPDKNEIRVYPSFGKKQFEGFRANFRSPRGGAVHIDASSGGVIAGLHCTKYQITDRDSNPIVQIFIEPRSGMLAKRVLFDPTGNIAGSYEFTSVVLNPKIQRNAFTIYRKGATIIHPIDELRKQGIALGMPALTLKGSSPFKLESVYAREIKGSKVIVQNFGSEDSRLTLFMTKSTLDAADLRKFVWGELRSYVWTLNGVTLVMIGDLPEERLRALSSQVSD